MDLIPNRNLLKRGSLSVSLTVVTASERALDRIRHQMKSLKISQRDLAVRLKTSQPRIAKILHKGVHLRVDDLEKLAHAVGVDLVETIRDRGKEFYAEMTPTELRLLERLRANADLERAVLLVIQAAEISAQRAAMAGGRKNKGVGAASTSGKTPTIHGGLPDGRYRTLQDKELDRLKRQATALILELTRFATSGTERDQVGTLKGQEP